MGPVRFVLVIMLITALGFAVPASALETVAADEPSSGIDECRKALGRTVCVAVMVEGCSLWVSAGWGGCFIR